MKKFGIYDLLDALEIVACRLEAGCCDVTLWTNLVRGLQTINEKAGCMVFSPAFFAGLKAFRDASPGWFTGEDPLAFEGVSQEYLANARMWYGQFTYWSDYNGNYDLLPESFKPSSADEGWMKEWATICHCKYTVNLNNGAILEF